MRVKVRKTGLHAKFGNILLVPFVHRYYGNVNFLRFFFNRLFSYLMGKVVSGQRNDKVSEGGTRRNNDRMMLVRFVALMMII